MIALGIGIRFDFRRRGERQIFEIHALHSGSALRRQPVDDPVIAALQVEFEQSVRDELPVDGRKLRERNIIDLPDARQPLL